MQIGRFEQRTPIGIDMHYFEDEGHDMLWFTITDGDYRCNKMEDKKANMEELLREELANINKTKGELVEEMSKRRSMQSRGEEIYHNAVNLKNDLEKAYTKTIALVVKVRELAEKARNEIYQEDGAHLQENDDVNLASSKEDNGDDLASSTLDELQKELERITALNAAIKEKLVGLENGDNKDIETLLSLCKKAAGIYDDLMEMLSKGEKIEDREND